MKSLFLILIFVFTTVSAGAQHSLAQLLKNYNTQSIPYISVAELRILQFKEGVVILDAREPDEFQVSHINGSRYIGFDRFRPNSKCLQEINKKDAIIVYCSVGIRSETIGKKLKDLGFVNVKNLYGGIFEWKNKNFPVVDSSGAETENIHTFSKKWSKYLHAGNPIY